MEHVTCEYWQTQEREEKLKKDDLGEAKELVLQETEEHSRGEPTACLHFSSYYSTATSSQKDALYILLPIYSFARQMFGLKSAGEINLATEV